MINYGNSRALVAVVDKLPTVQEDNWPQRGQIISGKPLSINYNENVFGEMPSQEDTEQESRYSEEKERVQEVFRPKVEEVQNNDGGFFIVASAKESQDTAFKFLLHRPTEGQPHPTFAMVAQGTATHVAPWLF